MFRGSAPDPMGELTRVFESCQSRDGITTATYLLTYRGRTMASSRSVSLIKRNAPSGAQGHSPWWGVRKGEGP